MKLACTSLALLALAVFGWSSIAQAQSTMELPPSFLPIPAAVKARLLPIDERKGYLVKELKPHVYMITDGTYQSLFVTTGAGVILFDAPPTFASKIVQAAAEVTKEPIKELVYSHSHLDHIAGVTDVMKQVPQIQILAEGSVASFLKAKNDPRRPVPRSHSRTITCSPWDLQGSS